jgi:hypothetical protein
MKLKPSRGAIALCSNNKLGIIMSDKPVEVTYPDETKGVAWTGFHLSGEDFGKPWSSREPNVITTVARLEVAGLKRNEQEEEQKKQGGVFLDDGEVKIVRAIIENSHHEWDGNVVDLRRKLGEVI